MNRDVRIDTLRGMMLVVMAIDHVSLFSLPVYEGLGFISAAQGFIFLSGIVVGLVYGKYAELGSREELRKKARSRAKIIYLSHLLIYLFILFSSVLSSSPPIIWKQLVPLISDDPLKALILGAALLDQPRFLDILPMYVLFVLISPTVLLYFKSHKEKYVLLGSLFIWGAAQLGVRKFIYTSLGKYITIDLGYFDIFAWQIVYICGLYVGYTQFYNQKGKVKINWLLFALSLVAIIGMFLVKHELISIVNIGKINLDSLTDKEKMRPLRLFNFFVFCYAIAVLSIKFKNFLKISPIAYLGRHSLQVFSFHVLFLFFIVPYYSIATLITKIFIVTSAVLSLYIPAWGHVRYKLFLGGMKERAAA
jgi:hypothetical protein